MSEPAPRAYVYRFFGMFRLLLAALVMLQHFAANAAPEWLTLAVQPYEPGSLAVFVFFALSGFVIAESADIAYRRRPAAFLTNRALRILPHFFAAMLLSMALHAWFVHDGTLQVERGAPQPMDDIFRPGNLALNFFSILPGVDRRIVYNFIPIAWAVRIEAAFYLVIAAALWLAVRLRRPGGAFALPALAAVLLLSPLFALAVLKKAPPMFGFLPYFTFGVALYFLLIGRRRAGIMVAACIPAIIWHFLSLPPLHPALGFTRAVGPQLAILLLLLAGMTMLARLRCDKLWRLDARIGIYTYPLYLYHYVVLIACTALLDTYSLSTFAFGMTAGVVFSVLMSHALDPLVDRWRDKVRGRRLSTAKEN